MIALALASRVLIALIFGIGLAGKLRDTPRFVLIVQNYRLVPLGLARPLAGGVMAAEALTIAAMLALPSPFGPCAAAVLLGLFAMAMSINLLRGRRYIACGCTFGAAENRLGWALVFRNCALASLALASIARLGWPAHPLEWIDGIGAGLALCAFALAVPALLDLRARAAALRARSY